MGFRFEMFRDICYFNLTNLTVIGHSGFDIFIISAYKICSLFINGRASRVFIKNLSWCERSAKSLFHLFNFKGIEARLPSLIPVIGRLKQRLCPFVAIWYSSRPSDPRKS